MLFIPDYRTVAVISGTYPAEELLTQKGMFAADLTFAYTHATPVLKTILDCIPASYHQQAAENCMELNIDVRVHELLPGEYPATPGWHCDAPQRETQFVENAATVPVKQSLVVNVSSHSNGVSNTVFATKPVNLPNNRMDYSTWELMNTHYGTDLTPYHVTKDGEYIQFSPYTPHCIQPAQHAGVRMFVRISQWQKPSNHHPGLAKTEQVYRTVKLL